MDITRSASAGTLESSDIYVVVTPFDGALHVEVDSVVKRQFGRQIEASIREVCADMGVTQASIYANDRGALDMTIRARAEAALLRASAPEGEPI